MTGAIVPMAAFRGGTSTTEQRIHHQHMQGNMARYGVKKQQDQHNMMTAGTRQRSDDGSWRANISSRSGSAGRGSSDKQASGSIMASGNQVMLQRQRRIMSTSAQNQQQMQLQKQRKKKKESQEQQSIGHISMHEVMHNLQMLEQQQVNARQKLLESRQIKAQDIELQKQLHLLLEGKKFANGQARGELDKYRDFLSFASRKLGDRKRSSAQLDSDINDFHSRLDNGIKSAKMIKVTGFMIDSILAAVQKKVQALSLMEDKCSIALKSEIDKYEKAKHEEQRLRSSIHKWQSDAQKWAGQNKTLSDEVAKLEIDKTDVQTKEEDSKNELRCIRDDIKEEEKRFAKLEEAKTAEVNESRRQLNILLEEVTIVEGTLGSVEATLQNEKLQTFDCVIVEGWTMEDESDPEEFKAAITSSETAMESEFHARQCKFSACELELQEMEKELESIENCTNERETSLEAIQSQVEAIKETEEMQQLEAAEVERQLANDRTEMQELETALRTMKETRKKVDEQNGGAESDMMVEQSGLRAHLETLESEAKAFKQKMDANAAYFKDIQMPSMLDELQQAEDQVLDVETSYYKLDREEMEVGDADVSDTQISDLLQSYPQFTDIETKYDPYKPFIVQVDAVLRDFMKQPTKKPRVHKTQTWDHYRPQNDSIEPQDTDFSQELLLPEDLRTRPGYKLSADKPKQPPLRFVHNKDTILMKKSFQDTTATYAAEKRVRWQEEGLSLTGRSKPTKPSDYRDNTGLNRLHPSKSHPQKGSSAPVDKSTKPDPKPSDEKMDVSEGNVAKPRRRSRKKTKAVLANDSETHLNSRESNNADGMTVLEKAARQIPSKELVKKRKSSDIASEKADSTFNPRATTKESSQDGADRKRRKLSHSNAERVRDDARKSKNHHSFEEKDKLKIHSRKELVTNNRIEHISKQTTINEKDDKIRKSSKSRDGQRRHEEQPTKSGLLAAKTTNTHHIEKGQPKHRQENERTKQAEENKSFRSDQAKTKDSRKSLKDKETKDSRKSLKEKEKETKDSRKSLKEKEKASRDQKSRKRKTGKTVESDVAYQKKDGSRTKKSSSSLAKTDDVSRASKASKSRRSRKKSGNATENPKKSGVMEDDFGFNF